MPLLRALKRRLMYAVFYLMVSPKRQLTGCMAGPPLTAGCRKASFKSTTNYFGGISWRRLLLPVTALPICPWQSGKRTLFDIGGRNIILLKSGNQAKVSVSNRNMPKAPGQAKARIVGYDGSIPETIYKGAAISG